MNLGLFYIKEGLHLYHQCKIYNVHTYLNISCLFNKFSSFFGKFTAETLVQSIRKEGTIPVSNILEALGL